MGPQNAWPLGAPGGPYQSIQGEAAQISLPCRFGRSGAGILCCANMYSQISAASNSKNELLPQAICPSRSARDGTRRSRHPDRAEKSAARNKGTGLERKRRTDGRTDGQGRKHTSGGPLSGIPVRRPRNSVPLPFTTHWPELVTAGKKAQPSSPEGRESEKQRKALSTSPFRACGIHHSFITPARICFKMS